MDKQKSYGKNYDAIKLKHKFSLRFVLSTVAACVIAVAIVVVCVRI